MQVVAALPSRINQIIWYSMLGCVTRLVQLVTQLVTQCRYMAKKTLVRKNGLVRHLVTTSSNGPVRKLVTRCLSEIIKTSAGNKLQAQIAAFPRPCLRHCPTSCSHCLCFPMYIPGSWCSQSANALISWLLAQPQQRSGTRSWLLACPPDGSGKGSPLGPGRVCQWEYGPCGLAAKI